MLSLGALRLENFITYESQIFKFSNYFKNNRLLLMLGNNLDGSGAYSSNGAGKSLPYEAFLWVLFGRTTRGGIKDGVIGKFDRACEVSAEIKNLNTGDIYNISRYRRDRTHGNNVVFKINGEQQKFSISTDVDKFICHTLGISYNKTINTSIFRSDDERKRFVYMGQPDRLQLLGELRGTDIFPVCEKIAGDDLKAMQAEHESVHTLLQDTLRQKRTLRHDLSDLQSASIEYMDDINRQIKKLRKDRGKEIVKCKGEINKVGKEIEAEEEAIEELKDSIRGTSGITKLEKASKGLLKEKHALERDLHTFNRKLKGLYSTKDKGKICDRCGSVIDRKKIKEYRIEIKSAINTTIHQLKANAKDLAGVTKKLDRLMANRDKNTSIKAEISVRQESVRQLRKQKALIRKNHLETMDRIDKQIIDAEASINPYATVIEEKLNYISLASTHIAEYRVRLTRIKDKLKYVQAWKVGYGREHIQHEALQGVVARLNKGIQQYSNELTNGEVDMQLITEKKIGTKRIKNLMDLDITDSSKEGSLPFKEWSTGEKKRIEVIMSFAAIDLDQNVFAELFLDELFDGLDTTGMNRVVGLLEKKAAEGRNIVVISHVPEIQDHFDNVLTVVREEGRSRI